MDPAASNGAIVGRLARNADPVGTADQTGNGRLNLARALADTATDAIVPAGAPGGGPLVGPYVAATKNASINDRSLAEGNSGTTTMTFTVSTTGSGTGTIDYTTAPSGANPATEGTGTCNPGEDYIDSSGTLTFSGGANESKTIDVTICGDTTFESNETFTVTLSNATNATGTPGQGMGIADNTGVGTITNDDAANTPPAGTNKTVTTNEDTPYTFAAADFGFTDVDAGDTLSAVRIDTLSLAAGSTLRLSGVDVAAAQVIVTADIGNLVFTPALNANGAGYASFTFSVRDTGGPAFDPSPNTITINVTAVNDAPIVTLSGPSAANEGDLKSYTFSTSDIDSSTFSLVSESCGANGTLSNASFTPATGAGSFDCTFPDGPASSTVSVQVADSDLANSNISSITVTVNNVAPSVVVTGDSPVNEGQTKTYTFDTTDPGTLDTFSAGTPSCGASGTYVALSLVFSTATGDGTFDCSFPDDSPTATASDLTTVGITITDDDTGAGAGSKVITVNNVAPVITSMNGPIGPIAVGNPATVTANFTDVGSLDTHTCTATWDLAYPIVGTISAGVCTVSRSDLPAGVYSVVVTVTDDDGGSTSQTLDVYVVVYDPSAGFVTGGGWINTPVDSYTVDPNLSGKATFGFVSKYLKGAKVPTGSTEFQFHVAKFNFKSTSYDWLVVSGAKAQYKGTGTVNGVSGYTFLLTATDGQVSGGGGIDKFRIKIRDAGGAVIYDNAMGASDDIDSANPQDIASGSIVIHK